MPKFDRVEKVRIEVSKCNQQKPLWRFVGLKLQAQNTSKLWNSLIKLSGSQINSEDSNFSQDCFGNLFTKIMSVITDEDFSIQFRLRAVNTVNAFITLNSEIIGAKLKNLRTDKLLKLLYSWDSRGWADVVSLLTSWWARDKSDEKLQHVINDISNIHQIPMTRPGREALLKLWQVGQLSISNESMFKLICETLYYRVSKEAIAWIKDSRNQKESSCAVQNLAGSPQQEVSHIKPEAPK